MKNYILPLMGLVGFLITFVAAEIYRNMLFANIGVLIFGLAFPASLVLDMFEEKKKEEK